jgi:hypothetical protein
MLGPLLSVFRSSRWEDGFQPRMRLVVADTEYQVGWHKKFDELKDDEKKEEFNSALGDLLKWCLRDASNTFNLTNPNFKDIDNNTVFVKSITSYKISPIFAVSTTAEGVKTVIGVPDR